MVDVRLAADAGRRAAGRRRAWCWWATSISCRRSGPGTVLARRDRLAARSTVVRLTEIFRQAAASLIVVNAHRIHDGELPEPRPRARPTARLLLPRARTIRRARRADPRSGRRRACRARYGLDPSRRSRCWRRCTGASSGAGNLNQLLQEALNRRGAERRRAAARSSARRRQGDAAAQQLRQGGVQRRHRRDRAHRRRGRQTCASASTAATVDYEPRRARRAGRSPTRRPSTSRRAPSTRPW